MTTLSIPTPRVFSPLLEPARYKGAYGGRGCVLGDTLLDTPEGSIPIKDFPGGPVYSYDGGIVVVEAAPPVLKR